MNYLQIKEKDKNKNNKEWYKKVIESIDLNLPFFTEKRLNNIEKYKNVYFNRDVKSLSSLLNSFSDCKNDEGDFQDKDIISSKIKALKGAELRLPNSIRIVALNKSNMTLRKEKEKQLIKDLLILELENFVQEDEQEQKKLNPDVEYNDKFNTIADIKKYVERDYQTDDEIAYNALMEYLTKELNLSTKFSEGWENAIITGEEIYYIDTDGNLPKVEVVPPEEIIYDNIDKSLTIEDREWVRRKKQYYLSDFINKFEDDLDSEQKKSLQDLLKIDDNVGKDYYNNYYKKITVYHYQWKAYKLVKFLTSINLETGEEKIDIVDENYIFNEMAGDIFMEEKWIKYAYEGYKIQNTLMNGFSIISNSKNQSNNYLYLRLRELPYQIKNLDDLDKSKFHYVGILYDNSDSGATSILRRLLPYQNMINKLWEYIEKVINSDRGNKLFMYADLFPKNGINGQHLSIKEWFDYFRKDGIMMVNSDDGNINLGERIKNVDLSMSSDVEKWFKFIDYIDQRAGQSVGIPRAMEGVIDKWEKVNNTQTAIQQANGILQPYFKIHNNTKKNLYEILLEVSKFMFKEYQPDTLGYVTDDLSFKILTLDLESIKVTNFGLYISDSDKLFILIDKLTEFAQASFQNDLLDMESFAKVLLSDNINEIRDILHEVKVSKEQRQQQQQELAQQELESLDKQREHEINLANIKGNFDLEKAAIVALGFDSQKDRNENNIPDVLEYSRKMIEERNKTKSLNLKEKDINNKNEIAKEKLKIEREKLKKNN